MFSDIIINDHYNDINGFKGNQNGSIYKNIKKLNKY